MGVAICRRLAEEGADLVVADIRVSGAEDVARTIAGETGGRALALDVDVTGEMQVRQMIGRILAKWGGSSCPLCSPAGPRRPAGTRLAS